MDDELQEIQEEIKDVKKAMRAGTAFLGLEGEALQRYFLQLNDKENLVRGKLIQRPVSPEPPPLINLDCPQQPLPRESKDRQPDEQPARIGAGVAWTATSAIPWSSVAPQERIRGAALVLEEEPDWTTPYEHPAWAYRPPETGQSKALDCVLYEVICNEVWIHREACSRSLQLARRTKGQLLEIRHFDHMRCWGLVLAPGRRRDAAGRVDAAESGWVLVNHETDGPLLRLVKDQVFTTKKTSSASSQSKHKLRESNSPEPKREKNAFPLSPAPKVEPCEAPSVHGRPIDQSTDRMLYEVVHDVVNVRREPLSAALVLSRRVRGQILELQGFDPTNRWGEILVKTCRGIEFGWVMLCHAELGPLLSPWYPAHGEDLLSGLERKRLEGKWDEL